MIVKVSTGLYETGDCGKASGDVPQEELGPPMLECEEDEGDADDAGPAGLK